MYSLKYIRILIIIYNILFHPSSEETDVRMTGSVAAVQPVAVERLLEIDEEEEKRAWVE